MPGSINVYVVTIHSVLIVTMCRCRLVGILVVGGMGIIIEETEENSGKGGGEGGGEGKSSDLL